MGDIRISQGLRNEIANTIKETIDGGIVTGIKESGMIRIYSGIQPSGPGSKVTAQELLVELIFSSPCAPIPTDGVLIFNEIGLGESILTGKATWARITNGDGKAVFDCDVGSVGSGAILELNSVDVVMGGPIRIKNFTIMVP